MCNERYAEEVPFGFSKYQLPPTSSEASKHVWGIPRSASDLQAVSPLTPAPITHTEGSSLMSEILRWCRRARDQRLLWSHLPVAAMEGRCCDSGVAEPRRRASNHRRA